MRAAKRRGEEAGSRVEPGDDARRKAAWEEEGNRVEPGDDARRKAA